jgi:hypothetical protein
LRNQEGDGFNDVLAALLKALESSTVPVATVVAANDFLKRMEAET